ncbi:protein of unknown function [Variovorax sp. OK605]|uniref:DUF4135 domain-containing protein n=1 Tax=Variovorax sp. OK605 TaxID=1855317 RepID=UPI0008EE659F|nr:DUF4135 domain-containing protein [Variovorax sp. OK605]SFP86603.1 protein of unknown function [Variovorax sp. OK605]
MPPVGIVPFAAVAAGTAPRVTLSHAGTALRAPAPGFLNSVSLFFTRNVTLQAQNLAVRQDFANMLTNQFGAVIANRVFTPAQVNNTPLSAHDVRAAIGPAGIAVGRDAALAPHAAVGAFGLQKLEAREAQMFRAMPAGPLQASIFSGAAGAQVVAAYTATGAAAIDREATRMAASPVAADVNAMLAVNHAVANMVSPNALRQPLYEPFLQAALANMAPACIAADPRPNCPLLTQMAGKLAESLDNHIGMMMLSRGAPNHDVLATQLAADVPGMLNANPSLLHALDTEMSAFAGNVNSVLGRVTADRVAIEATFFGAVPAGDIVNLRVTDSDPHHGGQRVMILEFANFPAQPVVYKPRDCRVDAFIAGEAGVGNVAASVADVVNQTALGAGTIPTYRYLLGGVAHDEYAFVEHLSHQPADFDCAANVPAATGYFRDMGRQAAVAYMLGVTDLHHGNFIVSGLRPHMTDLEIAFSRSVLDRGGAAPSVGTTGLDRALISHDENAFQLPFTVGGGGAFVPRAHAAASDTSNFVRLNGHIARLDDVANGAAFQAAAQAGFDEIIDTFAQPVDNLALTQLLQNHFAGFGVRYHPVTTMTQLNTLEVRKLNPDRSPEQAVAGTFIVSDVDQAYALADVQTRFAAIARSDFAVGDVAYFTRQLGNVQNVFHHDHNGAHVVPDPGHVFGYDGMGDSLARINDILTQPATVTQMKVSMGTLL